MIKDVNMLDATGLNDTDKSVKIAKQTARMIQTKNEDQAQRAAKEDSKAKQSENPNQSEDAGNTSQMADSTNINHVTGGGVANASFFDHSVSANSTRPISREIPRQTAHNFGGNRINL